MDTGVLLLLIFLGLFILFIIITYNRLVVKRNMVDKAFAGIDAQSKKRYDLIPNIVASVQQYVTHEKETLKEITELRTRAISGNVAPDERIKLEDRVTQDLARINIAVENYPELKANENFMQLQRSLNEVEAQLAASRRSYNAAVTDFNNTMQMFPSNMIAGMFNFKPRTLFEITEQERQNVDIKKLFKE
jgi:LemA protein